MAFAFCVCATGVLPAPGALCQTQSGGDSRGVSRPAEKKTARDGQVKRSLRMEELEIYGDVEKPKTMFVIPRASLRYSRKAREKDFRSEILDPVSKEWVEDTQRWRTAVPPP